MQAINPRKFLAVSAAITVGFVGVFALSSQKMPFCGLPSAVEGLPSANSPSGAKNMDTLSTRHAVEHADESNFDQLVVQSQTPVLVDFYADWCGPCKRLAPILDEIAKENANVRVVKVNVDTNPNLAWKYGIESIPSVKVFRGGKIVAESLGLASKAELQNMLTR